MAHVRIVMATWQGAAFLAGQLASIAALDHRDWSLLVSDDGSTDATRAILADFATAHPGHDIAIVAGPGQGSAANFLSAIGRGLPAGAHLALSDQDDIWMPDRIGRALGMLAAAGPGPAAYASRTVLIDADGAPLGPSLRHPRGPSFGNALVQNILAGNTIVLNPAAAALAVATAPAALAEAGVPHHDWWIYLLMTGGGAAVINDDRPGVFYRQHGGNHMGAPRGLRQAQARLSMLRDGRYRGWIDRNLAALFRIEDRLTPPARALLHDFAALRGARDRAGLPGALRRRGIRRQTVSGDLALWVLARSGRL